MRRRVAIALERALNAGTMAPPLRGDELERDAVHAIPKTGRLRAVVEHVPKMTCAAAAMHLGADQEEEAALLRCSDCPLDRGPEARPTRPAVELGARGEQRQIASGTEVGAGPIFLVERARTRTLGQVPTKHGVLLRGELTTPFRVGLDDLELVR